jgi:hypothetical protein
VNGSTGARVGDVISIGTPSSFTGQAGLIPFAYVFANDTIRFQIANVSGGSLTPPEGTWTFLGRQRADTLNDDLA